MGYNRPYLLWENKAIYEYFTTNYYLNNKSASISSYVSATITNGRIGNHNTRSYTSSSTTSLNMSYSKFNSSGYNYLIFNNK